MSNRVYESFLKTGLPKRPDGKNYTSTAYIIYGVMCYRYNEQALDDKGRPNRGYKKSYPGYKTLRMATGRSKSRVYEVLKELLEGGVLEQITDGETGNRAEFRPTFHLRLLGDDVQPTGHVKRNTGKRRQDYRVLPRDIDGTADRTTESCLPDPISTISNISTKRNDVRFSELLLLLPNPLQNLQPGKNIEESLDRLEAKGIPLEATGRHLSEHNYTGASSPISVLIRRLETFSKSQPDLIAGQKLEHERTRKLDEQNAEIERAKVTPEVASEYIKSIRELWKMPKE